MTSGRPGDQRTRVRMYRVGFGDCFLISIPAGADYRHILVDCGVHAQGDVKTMGQVIANIAEVTEQNLSVVIATHAHQDHISGFATFADAFSQFSIGEVWMPWTENPKDAQAMKLRRRQTALAQNLHQHFTARGDSPGALAVVANLLGNQASLQLLRSGFGGRARVCYFEAGDELTDALGITGLSVRILGPPRNPEFLAKMNPPASQRYLHLGPDGEVQVVNTLRPFASRWNASLESDSLRKLRLSSKDKKRLQEHIDTPGDLAFTLDSVINNTSLVTIFNVHGRLMLFPGDAQYGSWKWWLEQEDAEDILSQISFYKVAHHGSHNATPRDALEKMATGQFAAMVSTQSAPWPSIPQTKLMTALDRQTSSKIVRSDSILVKNAPKGPKVAKLPEGFKRGDLWFDYLIETI